MPGIGNCTANFSTSADKSLSFFTASLSEVRNARNSFRLPACIPINELSNTTYFICNILIFKNDLDFIKEGGIRRNVTAIYGDFLFPQSSKLKEFSISDAIPCLTAESHVDRAPEKILNKVSQNKEAPMQQILVANISKVN